MYRITLTASLIISVFLCLAQKKSVYPIAPKDSIFNQYFDTTIYDPYQWMENPNDPRLKEWLEAQEKIRNKEQRSHVHKDDFHAQAAAMFYGVEKETLDDYVDRKTENDDKYEFKKNVKTYNRAPDIIYRKKGTTVYKTLVKIKDFQKNKKDHVIVTNTIVNEEFDIAAVVISHNGTDWREAYFYDLLSGNRLDDTLQYLRIGCKIIWQGKGAYYDRYKKPEEGFELLNKAEGQTLCYHRIGDKQDADSILYENPDFTGTHRFYFFRKDSSRLFFDHYLFSGAKTYKALGFANIGEEKTFKINNFIAYPKGQNIDIDIEEIFGDTVILRTNWNAPNGKVFWANMTKQNDFHELVPEFDIPLREVNRIGKDKLACAYRNNGKYSILIYDLQGELLRKLDFPEGKKVKYFYEKDTSAEFTDFCISSFNHPNLWYQLSLSDFSYKPSQSVTVPYEPEDLETRYIKYKSKDGTEIPMYISCLKSTVLDGNNPTLLYGYGGYGIVVEPSFSEFKALWMLHGGILAIPNIRGGGAEGGVWSDAGRRLNKQNAIDDFIAAAEYLIESKYTKSQKLAINGGSHGGLLVGAALTQRPELFKTAIAEAGVYDLLRFEEFTIGSTMTSETEFGSVKNLDDFENMVSISPIHNIKEGVEYPNVLLMTGDHDDRVPPLHSYKFLATLQERGSPKSEYKIYVTEGSGHGGATTTNSYVEEVLFKYYYLFDQLGVEFWKGK